MTATVTPITAEIPEGEPSPTIGEQFWDAAAADDPRTGPISFDRCVDWLLGLHDSTADPGLRALVVEVLIELRRLGPVEGDFEDVVLGALASIEAAFEIRGAETA